MAVKASFLSGKTAATTDSLYQWDYGQQLEIEAFDLPAMLEVHFSCPGMSETINYSCSSVNGVATVLIPDRCLEQTRPITAWVYEIDGNTGKTTKTITIPITARTRPSRTESVPETVYDKYTEAITAMNEAVAAVVSGDVTAAKAVSATTAENAVKATTAVNANYATNAGTASSANSAVSSERAGYAIEAGHATDADVATTATYVSTFVAQNKTLNSNNRYNLPETSYSGLYIGIAGNNTSMVMVKEGITTTVKGSLTQENGYIQCSYAQDTLTDAWIRVIHYEGTSTLSTLYFIPFSFQ